MNNEQLDYLAINTHRQVNREYFRAMVAEYETAAALIGVTIDPAKAPARSELVTLPALANRYLGLATRLAAQRSTEPKISEKEWRLRANARWEDDDGYYECWGAQFTEVLQRNGVSFTVDARCLNAFIAVADPVEHLRAGVDFESVEPAFTHLYLNKVVETWRAGGMRREICAALDAAAPEEAAESMPPWHESADTGSSCTEPIALDVIA